MKTKLLAGCAAMCAAVALSGCAAFSPGPSADLLKQIDTNFANCERHLTFQAGLGVVTPGAQVSGSVDCKGASRVEPAAIAAPPAN